MQRIDEFQDSVDRGFTLIEIMIVLVLMSLILGISTVFFANIMPAAKQKAAAREIVSTLRYAKKLAAIRNERQILQFDLDTGRYGIKGRGMKMIPEETALKIYESDINADPITKGQYNITFDSTDGGHWDKISLVRRNRIIQIASDPILTAFIEDVEKDERRE